MPRNWARFLAGIVTIAIVWIGAYWWLNPRPSTKISFGGPGPREGAAKSLPKAPAPQPLPPVQIVDVVRQSPTVDAPRPEATARTDAAPIAPPRAATPPRASTPAVTPPRFEDYTVRSGDTLTSIAAARLGSTRHVDAIRRSNPLKDLDKLKAGDVIRIPADPTNIQGKPAQGSPSPAPPVQRQGELIEYTVMSGDTLSKIAKDKYGSASYQDLIYQANRDRLSSPNSLKEGQKLRLPRKPAA